MATFVKYLAAGSSAADKYSLTLQVDATHNSAYNKDTIRVRGTIKSHNSSYYSYRNSSNNTVIVTDEDGTTHLSKYPTTAYDCRNQGSTQIFDYIFDVVHGSDGMRTLDFSWSFDGLQSSWNPSGTVTGSLELTRTSFTISFDDNGGSGGPANQMKYYGTALALPSTKPTLEGYDFVEWNTNSDGSGTSYAAGGTYSTNASVTLYAIWKLKTYDVSYNMNGGSGGPSTQTKTYGKDLVLSSVIPTKKGHKFLGWGTSSTDTTVDYSPGSRYTANASITLYAIWKKVENMAINQNGSWKKGMASIGGKKGTPYIKQNGVWKKGGA